MEENLGMFAEPHPISLGRAAQLNSIFMGLVMEPSLIALGGGQVKPNNTL
jgi:hypothetical protein